jgi:amino acid adenylation domain-containing protein
MNVKPPEDQQAIRARVFHPTGGFIKFKTADVEQSIPERFEQMVAKHPHRIALKTRNHELTYETLNKAANRLARTILSKHADDERPVAVLLPHDAAMIVGILAIFKTGKICVPLDPGFHETRTNFISLDCEARLVVTDNENLSLAYQLSRDASDVINMDESDVAPSENLGLGISPDALSYILYTSGSTGHPKGVVQSHRNVLYDVRCYINNFHTCAEDRLILFASCSGGEGMKNALAGLLNGATVCQWNIKREGFADLASWLVNEGITIWISTPAIFRNFMTTLNGEKRFTKLRLVRLGSGTVHKSDVNLYKEHLPRECILVNWLSSTEVGAFANYFIDKKTEITGDTVPVGYAVEGKEVLLLDDNRRDVGFNRVGEIAVKSRYLSSGYWRRPALTEPKFLPDATGRQERTYLTGDLGRMRPDGCLEYLGRKDLQVKIRGHRIEIAEIEMALLNHPAIKQAIVVAREDYADDQRLAAYMVAATRSAPAVSKLRGFLKETLPDYMIPSTWMFMEALPLTPNGKVDRQALPLPSSTRPVLDTGFVAPRTPIESRLAQIWSEVLSIDQVGVNDNFLDLGGHSLAATRLVSQVIKQFQVEVPLKSLFESPTVAEMGRWITDHRVKKLSEDELESILNDLESMSDEQARKSLSEQGETKEVRDD